VGFSDEALMSNLLSGGRIIEGEEKYVKRHDGKPQNHLIFSTMSWHFPYLSYLYFPLQTSILQVQFKNSIRAKRKTISV
jgi:hypothetical protein